MKNHKDLEVWKEAVELSVACYRATKTFPQVEQFGLASQMRRAWTITHKQGTNTLVDSDCQNLIEEAFKIISTKLLVTNHQTKPQFQS